MGHQVYDNIRRLRSDYASLSAPDKDIFRASITAIVKRSFPALSDTEAWDTFNGNPSIQRDAVLRAINYEQANAIYSALAPMLPYEYEALGYRCRVEMAEIETGPTPVLSLQLRLFHGPIEVTPKEISSPERVRLVGPPVIFPDPLGDIVETFEENGESFVQRMREDPFKAVHDIVQDLLTNLVRKSAQ